MKKLLIQTGIGILFLVPLTSFAAEDATSSLRQTGTSTVIISESDASSTIASTTPIKTFTLCSQQAIENRDNTIAASRTIYNTAMAKALTERKNREKAAVAITDDGDKKDAIKVSVDTYKNQAKVAQTILLQARKVAWQTFENDIQKCHDAQDEQFNAMSVSKEIIVSEPATILRKVEKADEKEVKTLGDAIKAQFENFKALFN
jgi:hypothetical protein